MLKELSWKYIEFLTVFSNFYESIEITRKKNNISLEENFLIGIEIFSQVLVMAKSEPEIAENEACLFLLNKDLQKIRISVEKIKKTHFSLKSFLQSSIGLEKKAIVSAVAANVDQILFETCLDADLNEIKILFANEKIKITSQAFFHACATGQEKIVSFICSKFSRDNIDILNDIVDGFTPLMIATKNGHTKVVKLLLSKPYIKNLEVHGQNALALCNNDTIRNLLTHHFYLENKDHQVKVYVSSEKEQKYPHPLPESTLSYPENKDHQAEVYFSSVKEQKYPQIHKLLKNCESLIGELQNNKMDQADKIARLQVLRTAFASLIASSDKIIDSFFKNNYLKQSIPQARMCKEHKKIVKKLQALEKELLELSRQLAALIPEENEDFQEIKPVEEKNNLKVEIKKMGAIKVEFAGRMVSKADENTVQDEIKLSPVFSNIIPEIQECKNLDEQKILKNMQIDAILYTVMRRAIVEFDKIRTAIVHGLGLLSLQLTAQNLDEEHQRILEFGKCFMIWINKLNDKALQENPYYKKLSQHGFRLQSQRKKGEREEISLHQRCIFTLTLATKIVAYENYPATSSPVVEGIRKNALKLANIHIHVYGLRNTLWGNKGEAILDRHYPDYEPTSTPKLNPFT